MVGPATDPTTSEAALQRAPVQGKRSSSVKLLYRAASWYQAALDCGGMATAGYLFWALQRAPVQGKRSGSQLTTHYSQL